MGGTQWQRRSPYMGQQHKPQSWCRLKPSPTAAAHLSCGRAGGPQTRGAHRPASTGTARRAVQAPAVPPELLHAPPYLLNLAAEHPAPLPLGCPTLPLAGHTLRPRAVPLEPLPLVLWVALQRLLLPPHLACCLDAAAEAPGWAGAGPAAQRCRWAPLPHNVSSEAPLSAPHAPCKPGQQSRGRQHTTAGVSCIF